MKKVKVIHSASGQIVAANCSVANTLVSRLIGLLNHKDLPEGEGLLLSPANQVHTFFMRFPIDTVFLNNKNIVVGYRELKPWRFSPLFWSSQKVLEVPLGTCRRLKLSVGDELALMPLTQAEEGIC